MLPALSSLALLKQLLRRELTIRYVGTVTGLLWVLVHPIALLLAYHFVFSSVFRISAFGGQSFLTFAAIAMWPWLALQEGMTRAALAVQSHADLVKKVIFPHALLVVASVAATFLGHFVGFLVILGLLAGFAEPIHFGGLPVVVFFWGVLFLATIGIGLVLAALQVFMRDVEHVLGPVMMVLMWLAPVLYPPTAVPASLSAIVDLNPFTYVATRLREVLLTDNPLPVPGDLLAIVAAGLVLAAGYATFARLSPHFEEFV